jgi:hypothetical protein
VIHPSLNINMGNDRCFGCHSRSARISLNYEGWFETELKAKDVAENEGYRILQDQRVLEFKGADIHHTRGMECIDCHTARDAMGDGTAYDHQEEQVEISCADCHAKGPVKTVGYENLDADSRKILTLRNRENKEKQKYRISETTGRPLTNVFLNPDGKLVFQGKLEGEARELKQPVEACTGIGGHDRLTCQTCHTKWAPTCINCHTQFESQKVRKDHYTGESVQGAWKEYKSRLLAVSPALGVRYDKKRKKEVVDTFIPGMILTIGGTKENKPDRASSFDKKNKNYQIFQRMFSPTFSHTIQTEARSCESCHQDPWSIGIGSGRIVYQAEERSGKTPGLKFRPRLKAHPADGLPRDAWTGFLKTRQRRVSTRTGARPFNGVEQDNILRVGRCLNCHKPTPANMADIYLEFAAAFKKRPDVCKSLDFNSD